MCKALKEAKELRKYGRTNKEFIDLQCEIWLTNNKFNKQKDIKCEKDKEGPREAANVAQFIAKFTRILYKQIAMQR